MVDIGIVKFFNIRRRFGFLYILDETGDKTSDELFFHFNDGVYPTLGDQLCIDFSDTAERDYQLLRFPRTGDRIVFETEFVSKLKQLLYGSTIETGKDEICNWTYFGLWADEERKLLTVPLRWRLVRQSWAGYTFREDGPGSLMHADERVTSGYTIRQGEALLSDIRGRKAEDFGLYKPDPGDYRSQEDYEEAMSYTYVIEVELEDGSWVKAQHLFLNKENRAHA